MEPAQPVPVCLTVEPVDGGSCGAMGGVRFALGGARGGPEGKRCRRDCCTVLCGVLGKRRVRFFPSGCLLWSVLLRPSCVRGRSSPRGFLLFFLIDISSASSSTKFMYSSNPCQVKQRRMSIRTAAQPRPPSPASRSRACAHNDPPLDPHVCVLIQPDLHPSLLRRGSGTGQHEWGLAAAGSKALQRLQLRQAQAAHVLQKPEDQVLRKRRKGGRRGSAVWSVRW